MAKTGRPRTLTLPKDVLVDECDRELFESGTWHVNNGYIAGRIGRKGKRIYLHRAIMCPPTGTVVDHINGNRKDNRRCNLRVIEERLNQHNRTTQDPRNKSGFRGVCFFGKRWRAYATVEYKQKHLGLFDTPEEAAEAAKRWRLANMPGATT